MFKASLKKEWKEAIRRYRLLVIIGVFLIVGVLSPVSAKMLPKMMEMVAAQSKEQGIEFSYTKEPTANDALIQYNKNLGLLPILIAIMGMGLVAEEKIKGTAETILTKPVSRTFLLLAKFKVFVLMTVLGMIVGGAVCVFYTGILLGKVNLSHFLSLNFILLFYFIPFIAVILFLSVVIKSMVGAAASGIGVYFSLMLMGSMPYVGKFSPQALYTITSKMSMGMPAQDWTIPFISSVCLTIVLISLAAAIFEKQEI
jgi:ABC-2 type transport system permease protein